MTPRAPAPTTRLPWYRHAVRVEDIIHRAPDPGARLAVRPCNMPADGGLDEEGAAAAWLDGQRRASVAGSAAALEPGGSIMLFPGTTTPSGVEGGGVVLDEVSTVNDDQADHLPRPMARFSAVEEDAMPHRLPMSDRAARAGTASAAEVAP